MATDDIWGIDKSSGGGTRPAQISPDQTRASAPPHGRPDLARQIGRLEARLKSIAAPRRPAEESDEDALLDEAVTRLASEIRGGAIAGTEGKPRHDFRVPPGARPSPQLRTPPGNAFREDATARIERDLLPPAETIESQFEAIRRRIGELSDEPAPVNHEMPSSRPGTEEMPSSRPGADYLDMVERMEELARSVPDRDRIERLAAAADKLGQVIADSGHLSSLAAIEGRLGKLAADVSVLAQRRPADVEIYSRLAEIRDLVIAAGQAETGIARMESQIAAVADRIEGTLTLVPTADAIVALARRLDAVSGRLDQIGANQNRPLSALDALTREIVLLRRDVAAVSRPPDPAGSEAQVSALAARFDAQVAQLAEQMKQGAGVRPSPSRATPDAGKETRRPTMMTAGSGGEGESPIVQALREDLLRLQTGQPAAAQGPGTPSAPNETMEQLVRRLASIEVAAHREKLGARRPAAHAPRAGGGGTESVDDRRPLEPGSGRPSDRARRDARKADFVVAARRAAQAAAAESAAIEREEARSGFQPLARFGQALRRRHRTVIMTAVVIIALATLPIVSQRYPEIGETLAGGEEPAIAVVDAASATAITAAAGPPSAKAVEHVATGDATTPPSSGNAAIAFETPEPLESRFVAIDGASANRFTADEATGGSPSNPPQTADTPPPAETSVPNSIAPAFRIPAPMAAEAAGPARLRTAAAAGDPAAIFEIGARYAEGRGVTADFAEAAKWYGLAAERGLAVAQFRLASLNERGEGIAQNRKTAAEWYRRAAEQGNVRAMHNLAVMLSEGVGGPPDFAGAARWFARAADHGVKDSQYNLGVMFARGLGGPQDLVQSYKWFAIAAQQGDADATTRRDEVAKALSPDQLAQAQAAVLAWRASEPPEKANIPPVAEDGWDGPSGPLSALDRPALVKMIQERLADRGFDPGPADGQSGPMTREAVMAFQRDVGVPATGEIGPELLAALDLPTR